MLDYTGYIEKLIAKESPVLIYAGEFDAQDGPLTQEAWLRGLDFEGSDRFWSQARQTYWVHDSVSDSAEDGVEAELVVGGYWRTSEFLEFLTVAKAGHLVPANFFSASFQMLYDYIHNG